MPSAAVVGAGLSGLTAAHRLQQAGWSVEVFESRERLGGRVHTIRQDGYTVDTAATAVGAAYSDYRALAAELDVALMPSATCLAIPRYGTLHMIDMSHVLSAGLRTRLMSLPAKLRTLLLGLDAFRAHRKGYLDPTRLGRAAPIDTESAQAYARRRLGAEVDEYLIAPLMRAMLIANSDQASKVLLFSALQNIFGGTWLAPDGGAGSLIDALARQATVKLRHEVRDVRTLPDGDVSLTWRDADGATDTRTFDAAVIACPLPATASIYRDGPPQLARLAEVLAYTQTVTVSLGTTRQPRCPALMVLMPPSQDADVALFFLDHNKSPGRAPAGHGSLTFYWEAGAAQRSAAQPDAAFVEHATRTLERTFPEMAGSVVFSHVTRWQLALPHVHEGMFAEIGRLTDALDPRATVQLAGDYLSETGMNTAVAVGSRAAARLSLSPSGTHCSGSRPAGAGAGIRRV